MIQTKKTPPPTYNQVVGGETFKNYISEEKGYIKKIVKNGKVSMAFGHNRWASNGSANTLNSHPHDAYDEFFVVHNGIINNHLEIKEMIEEEEDKEYKTETDTESACRYAKYIYDKNEELSFLEIVEKVSKKCTGNNAFIFSSVHFPGEMIALNNHKTLTIGLEGGEIECGDHEQENFQIEYDKIFFTSDRVALTKDTKHIYRLKEKEIVRVFENKLQIYECTPEGWFYKKMIKIEPWKTPEIQTSDGNLFKTRMEQEIFDLKKSILRSIDEYNVESSNEDPKIRKNRNESLWRIKNSRSIYFIACGTSYHACLAVKDLFRDILGYSMHVEIASEFNKGKFRLNKFNTAIFVSQSGETADVITAMRSCKKNEAFCVGLTNRKYSEIEEGCDFSLDIHAGTEKAVGSTKAYTSQFATLIKLAEEINNLNDSEEGVEIKKERKNISEIIEKGFENLNQKIEETFANTNSMLDECVDHFTDRINMMIVAFGPQLNTAKEGALKIIELCNITALAVPAGELKHGPLGLLDEFHLVIQIIMDDRGYDTSLEAFQTIKGIGVKHIIICSEKVEFKLGKELRSKNPTVIIVPHTEEYCQGLLTVIPFQFLANQVALERGLDPDHPRNLAKSVTV